MTNILLVDDKKYNLDDMKDAISDLINNVKILLANDGDQAIKIINEEENLDLIITDLVMTKVDGMEVLKAAHNKDPYIAVILVTGNETILDRDKAYQSGAFDCIGRNIMGKTFMDEVIAKTKNAIEYRKSIITLSFTKRYFDPSIYKEIENNPTLLIPQNRLLTVVFWDIRGFSRLSEILKTAPQLISGFLREYLEAASKSIFKYNGVLDKFIGDGVMALFGALGEDKYSESDALSAILAAIDLRQEFNKIYNIWKPEWGKEVPNKIDIGLGCGIHTGRALVGNLGTSFRDHFTAVGSHVNFASRIEQTALKGQIIVSSTTKSRIEDKFNCRLVQTLENVKNISGDFEVFEVIA